MQIVWIHERGSAVGGAERYIEDVAHRFAVAGTRQVLLYDPRLPTSPSFLGRFDDAYPIVDLELQLAELGGDVVYAHRVPVEAEAALGRAVTPVVRMFHDHQLFCLREHKVRALGGSVCDQPAGSRCYPCGGFIQRTGIVPLGALRRRQRAAFSAAAFVVASRYLENEAAANGVPADRIVRLPLYARGQAPRRGLGRGVLFVGQLVRGKGADVLVEAAAQIDVRVTIIGDGAERAALEALARSRNVDVTFTGTLPPDRVAEHMASARVVVVPSRVPETFCLVGIEAQALGVPVIASTIGGISEWLTPGDTGLGVPAGNARALADALSRIHSDDTLAARLANAGRAQYLARFTPERHMAGLAALFAAVRARAQRAGGVA